MHFVAVLIVFWLSMIYKHTFYFGFLCILFVRDENMHFGKTLVFSLFVSETTHSRAFWFASEDH